VPAFSAGLSSIGDGVSAIAEAWSVGFAPRVKQDATRFDGSAHMRLSLLTTMIVLVLLVACQTKSENDPPVIKPYECPPHTLEAGTCGK
jgi:hypothetical protein